MASSSLNGITVFFDRYESLFQDGDTVHKDQFVHLRITNSTPDPIYIVEIDCINRDPASENYNVGNIPFSSSRTGANPIEIPANVVEYAIVIADNYPEGQTGDDLFFESGDLMIEGQVYFQGMSAPPNADYAATFDEVYKEALPQNTGYKGWTTLEEYDLETGIATGNEKPNDSADPDYVAPVYDTTACPLP